MLRDSLRRIAVVVASTLIVGLAACGGDDSSGESDLSEHRVGAMDNYGVGVQFRATEPLTFSILYNNHPNYQLNEDWLFWSELKKRTNVTLEKVAVPLSDYEQKRSVLISAGDAPFIISKTYPGQERQFVASGAILPVSDYIDLMPNFKDKVEKWNLWPELDTLRQEDGKFYVLPGLHEKPWQDYTLAMRMDVLEELNLAVPTTWDELYEVLKAMKRKYPNSYPLSDRFSKPHPAGNLLNLLAVTNGLEGAGWNFQHVSWDPKEGKFFYTYASEQWKKILEYLNKLVSEGLLDPETFTQTDDEARRKLASGKSFVISTNAQNIVNDYRPDLAKTNPKARIAKIPLPIGSAGAINPASRLENGLMISAKARQSKHFVAMMQFIDWLWYSDEGQEFAKWGVEGVTYTKDASGKRRLAPDVDVVGLNPKGTKHLQKDFGFYNGVFAYGGKLELVQSFFSEEELEFQKLMNERPNRTLPPPYPLSEDEREQVTLWETALQDHVNQNTLKFALGQRPLSEWDAYVNELKGKHMDEYVDIVNRAYQRYKEKHG